MNRWSLRGAYLVVTLVAVFGLVPGAARAHLEIRPGLVEQATVAEIRVELPQLRAGRPPTGLEVEGAGIEVLSSTRQGSVGIGSETAWRVKLRASGPPRVVPLVLRAVYADDASVEVDEQLTVVPRQGGAGFPWPGVIAASFLAVAFAGVSLHLARRKA